MTARRIAGGACVPSVAALKLLTPPERLHYLQLLCQEIAAGRKPHGPAKNALRDWFLWMGQYGRK